MPEPERPFVVGIGASAGGLHSLERFFDGLEHATGAAFIVVQHLSPNYETMMDKLLGRHTSMKVTIAEDGQPIEADHVYVIPPKKDLIVAKGRLSLSVHDTEEVPHMTIDRLFASIATEYGDRAIGVILSGTGSDGSRGIQAIRNVGGLVLSETESTAKFSGMPRSAQATGCVDHVVPPESMPRIIVRRIVGIDAGEEPETDDLGKVLRLMKDRLRVDFSQYKPATVTRRIERRMSICNVTSLGDFYELLSAEPDQIDLLYQDMLIGVTKFFRDPACFEYFEHEVAPRLLADADPDVGLRVWTPGCATGEESYTLAMVLHELNQHLPRPLDIKIFASDIHTESLRRGSLACYGEDALQNVSGERLARHFEEHEGQHRVRKHIRQHVLFAPHNLLQDPPFTALDMVSCRNLLIYFDSAAQNRALTLFHFGLKQRGVLFLGPSETIGELGNEFQTIHDRFRFYRKLRDARLPHDVALPFALSPRIRPPKPLPLPQAKASDGKNQLYDALLDELLPPTLLVDSERHVVEMYGGAEKFLALRGRKMSTDLLDLCPEPLQGVLSIGVRRVLAGSEPVLRLPDARIPLADGQTQTLSITMRLLSLRHSDSRFVAISFAEVGAANAEEASGEEGASLVVEFSTEGGELTKRVRELEDELAASQDSLQSTIEQLESSNEELQATNEELVSSNEELQSSNEELNSVNEELHTVNVEYQNKNAELRELYEDMNHLIASTDIGTVFLDTSLIIRRFTPSIGRLFNLEPNDIGRPLSAFSHNLLIDDLQSKLREVLNTGRLYEREVLSKQQTPYFLRMLPYELSGEMAGVTLTLTNIQALVDTRLRVDESQQRLQRAIDAVPVLVSFINRDLRYEFANRAYTEMLGVPTETMIGKQVSEILDAETYAQCEPRLKGALAGEPQHFEAVVGAEGQRLSVMIDYRPERDQDGVVTGIYVSAADISANKQAELELEAAFEAARLANDAKSDFLAKMSHEIRSPMAAILGFADILDRQLREPDDRNCIDIIRTNGEHLLSLINDLLDLSQIELRRIELASEVTNVRELLSGSYNTLRPRAAQNRVTLEGRLRDCLDAGLRTDVRRLKQVLINLLTNAIKFGAGGRVILSARRSHRRSELVISVADTGEGIAAADVERLFEPFCQLDASSNRAYEGSGLGLTICKQLVEQMGGVIRVRSQLGTGSVFQVRLPWEEVVPVADVEQKTDLLEALPRLDGKKVLVVDDRRDMRFIAEQILAEVGAEVTTVDNGATALATVADFGGDFHCVVTDIQMPLMDGYAVARGLRDQGYSGPILALTANAMPSDRQKCFEAGCDGFVAKPIDRTQFVKTVARSLSNGN
jgi:two-component system CheB/CheR fusion protein